MHLCNMFDPCAFCLKYAQIVLKALYSSREEVG